MLLEHGRTRATHTHFRAQIGRARAMFGRCSAKFGGTLAKIGPFWAEFGRRRANLVPGWSIPDRDRSTPVDFGRARSEFGPFGAWSADVCRICATCGRSGAELSQIRLVSVEFGRKWCVWWQGRGLLNAAREPDVVAQGSNATFSSCAQCARPPKTGSALTRPTSASRTMSAVPQWFRRRRGRSWGEVREFSEFRKTCFQSQTLPRITRSRIVCLSSASRRPEISHPLKRFRLDSAGLS